ncbi:MAG: hypothetical protein LUO93_09190 [Methanomicrobiales archaeon]|nr:hypothetical protein [Methanomicrobiales archaeon]
MWNHYAEKIATATIKNLKIAELRDRASISDENTLLYSRESLMNKLEFSRPVCIKKYLQEKGFASDALLKKAILLCS